MEASSDKRIIEELLGTEMRKHILRYKANDGSADLRFIGLGLGNGRTRIWGGEKLAGFGFAEVATLRM